MRQLADRELLMVRCPYCEQDLVLLGCETHTSRVCFRETREAPKFGADGGQYLVIFIADHACIGSILLPHCAGGLALSMSREGNLLARCRDEDKAQKNKQHATTEYVAGMLAAVCVPSFEVRPGEIEGY